MRRQVTGEIVLVLLLGAVAFSAGAAQVRQYRAAGGKPLFYQSLFAPAVMFACGNGYHNVGGASAPLRDFLDERTDSFDCGELGQSVVAPLDTFQRISRYLELAAGLVWRVRGISWSSLDQLTAILFAVTMMFGYGLFRLIASPGVASVATGWMICSPLYLANLPALRDFAKAPFVIGALLMAGLILKGRPSERVTLVMCAVGGALLGVGLGFRNDLLLFIPLLGAAIAFSPVSGPRGWLRRITRLAVFAALFLATGLTILRGYGEGNNTGHVTLLGLTVPFDAPLGIGPHPVDVGYLYNDSFIYLTVRSFADRTLGPGTNTIEYGSAAYDEATGRLLRVIAVNFPADLMARAVGAVGNVLHAPFTASLADLSYQRGILAATVRLRSFLAAGLAWPAAIAGIAWLIFAVCRPDVRLLAAALVVALIAAIAALQFDPRHYFYMEICVWWPLAGAISVALRRDSAVQTLASGQWHWRGGIAVCLAVLIGGLGLVTIVRSYQQHRLVAMLTSLQRTTRPIALTRQVPAEGTVRFATPPPSVTPDASHPVVTRYFAFEFGGPACDRVQIAPVFRYISTREFENFSRTMPLRFDGDGPVRVLMPAYHAAWRYGVTEFTTQFVGIDLPAADAECLVGAAELGGALPGLLPTAVLVPGWEQRPLYQRLWVEPGALEARRTFAIPPGLSRAALQALLAGPIDSAGLRLVGPNVKLTSNGLAVDGLAIGQYSYIARYEPRVVPSGSVVVATGDLVAGGLTIGIVRDGAWVQTLNVTTRGPFTVVLQVPTDGTYELVVANCLLPGERTNHFVLERFGWARTP